MKNAWAFAFESHQYSALTSQPNHRYGELIMDMKWFVICLYFIVAHRFFLLNIVWHMVCASFHCQTPIECWRYYVIDFSLSSLSSCLRVHASECCINQHFSKGFPPSTSVYENCKRNAMNPLGNRFYVCLEPITDERHKRFSRNENVSSRI